MQASTFRPTSAADIPIWKTIALGEYRDVSSLRSAFDNSPCHVRIGVSVDEAIGRPTFPFAQSKVELDLVVVSVDELGFPEDGASLEAIYARALSIGLDLCPPDLGPALRLNYLDQPRGEFLHIAMRPVALYNRDLIDFSLGNDGASLLIFGGDARSQLVLPGLVRFVFVQSRPDSIVRSTSSSKDNLAKH
ncbi:MAG: hypothetical protein JOZ94_00280 [Xanthobacteraceae bacterium]|nr:hypothetical protein [Xanthobacteraceae bacterium]MBV9234243.1 hypothetical protein [Xanthobacteraceae bacterium]MBV9627877.1 hypothetical protein [Xanthobacteraceae bacterium]